MIDLHSTTDAGIWVKEFLELHPELRYEQPIPGLDIEGILLTWFANAIETGRTAGQAWSAERSAELTDAQERESALLEEIANLRDQLARMEPTAGVGP